MADEIVKHAHFNRDRVTVSVSRKFNIAKYESVDIMASLTTDVTINDKTIEGAFDRAEKQTLNEYDRLCKYVGDKYDVEQ